jgi:hypothetical protein
MDTEDNARSSWAKRLVKEETGRGKLNIEIFTKG